MRSRADGMLIFDDDMSRLTDMMLNAEGVRNAYISGSHRTWIRKIGDESPLRSEMPTTAMISRFQAAVSTSAFCSSGRIRRILLDAM